MTHLFISAGQVPSKQLGLVYSDSCTRNTHVMATVEKKPTKKVAKKAEKSTKSSVTEAASPVPKTNGYFVHGSRVYKILKYVLTILAFCTRYYLIHNPDKVVFDEVHFGKFASHYLQREFYFDVHPPMGKMLFALVGYLVGYNGAFKFEQIGDSYVENNVPYIMYRLFPATLGALTVPLVFGILEHCHFSPYACVLAASCVLFDTAQITEERLILLDSSLIFFVLLSIYCYVRFSVQHHEPFSWKWYTWLVATGVSLSSVTSIKYVGLFTFAMIGVAVIADLYHLLDIRNKPKEKCVDLKLFGKHFAARFATLVVLPFLLYLFWFYAHFVVLSNSGPGDSAMSPEFQATLNANPVAKEAYDLHWFDTVSIKSVNSEIFLHSHTEHYPTVYEDGRVSSSGQQVTGYSHEDANGLWQIIPADTVEGVDMSKQTIGSNQRVFLRHVVTDSFLLAHDVASPSYPTNEEFTTLPSDQLGNDEMRNNCIFILDFITNGIGRTRLTHFRLKHFATKVSMWLSPSRLPEDWGFGQYEINGNKMMTVEGTLWSFQTIQNLDTDELKLSRKSISEHAQPRRSFWTDYKELQGRMFYSNARLTSEHPYMSSPSSWPFMKRGISFWSNPDNSQQIYLVGNHVAWYLVDFSLIFFVLIWLANHLAQLRLFALLPSYTDFKMNNTLMWFFVGYLTHYLPFFSMGRQLFLHHYLPAQAVGSLLAGGLFDIVTGSVEKPTDRFKKSTLRFIICGLLVSLIFAHYIYFAPLCYGTNMTNEQFAGREWLNIELQNNRVIRT